MQTELESGRILPETRFHEDNMVEIITSYFPCTQTVNALDHTPYLSPIARRGMTKLS